MKEKCCKTCKYVENCAIEVAGTDAKHFLNVMPRTFFCPSYEVYEG